MPVISKEFLKLSCSVYVFLSNMHMRCKLILPEGKISNPHFFLAGLNLPRYLQDIFICTGNWMIWVRYPIVKQRLSCVIAVQLAIHSLQLLSHIDAEQIEVILNLWLVAEVSTNAFLTIRYIAIVIWNHFHLLKILMICHLLHTIIFQVLQSSQTCYRQRNLAEDERIVLKCFS